MFDPAQRDPLKKIEEEALAITQSEYFTDLLEDIQEILLIINSNRQIIYVNRDLFLELDIDDSDKYLGLRPGECFGCIHPESSPHGCGSTQYCTVCGLANTVLEGEIKGRGKGECSILLKDGKALTLDVMTRKFDFDGTPYIFCAVKDISEIKRRHNFEDIFLHDLMNRAAAISSIVQSANKYEQTEALMLIKQQNDRLIDEINSHKILSKAESKALNIMKRGCHTDGIILEVIDCLEALSKNSGVTIITDLCHAKIVTDPTILRRVVLNLVKNALEASKQNETVVIRTTNNETTFTFSVKNNGYIPEEIQLKMFNRSFSTKDPGRGFGTYGVKLLVEQYLKGTVSFTSTKNDGTRFFFTIPQE